jgi:hypothetical protein
MHAGLHRTGGTSEIDTHDAQPSRIDFFSQTIRESLERVLGRRILPYISSSIESYTRVDEHYLTAAQSEHGEEGLRQCVGGTHVDTVVPVQVFHRRDLKLPPRDDASAVHQDVNPPQATLKALRRLLYIVVKRQVSLITKHALCSSTRPRRDCLERVAMTPHETEGCPLRCET